MNRGRRRKFTDSQRQQIWIAAQGQCQGCGAALSYWSFHCDHIWPHSRGGQTVLSNAQALCPDCNQRKSDQVDINRYFKKAAPRRWQAEFLERFIEKALIYADNPDQGFLLYATPGAGKTVAMCAAATWLRDTGLVDWVIIVVPSEPLCSQVASDAKALFGLDLRSSKNGLDSLFHGEVVTIQSLRNRDDAAIRRRHGRVLLCVDEFHHPSSRNSWGDDLARTVGRARYKLFCTGTPFRSDRSELKYVKYIELPSGELELIPDYAYPYRNALGDSMLRPDGTATPSHERIVRTARFHLYDANDDEDLIEWADNVAAPGIHFKHRLSDNLAAAYNRETEFTERQRRARLLAAINPQFRLARRMLHDAVEQLDRIRATHRHAGGLVVCKDKAHADEVADFMRRQLSIDPVVVYQGAEGAESSKKIKEFRKHTSPHKWIVAVQQVSEGVDIKRLRVCVWLTDKITHLIFLQILGRIIRWEHLDVDGKILTPTHDQMAHMFMPAHGSDTPDRDNPIELVKFAKEIEEDVSLIVSPTNRACDACGDNPASFGCGNCISTDSCPLYRGGGGGGGGVQRPRTLIGAGGAEKDAILRGEFYNPDLLNALQSKAARFGLPLDGLMSMLREVEVSEFEKDKAVAISATTTKIADISARTNISTSDVEVMTVSEQLSVLRAEVKKLVGKLARAIIDQSNWDEDDPRRQNLHMNIHRKWMKLGGSKTDDATIGELNRKIDWLKAQIVDLRNASLDEDLTRG